MAASSYLICMVQRCGSNVLCEALARTGVAGRPTEYFTPHFPGAEALGHELAGFERSAWARARGVGSLPEFLAAVQREGSTANGVFGAKVPWNAFGPLLTRLREIPQWGRLEAPELLSRALGEVAFVRVQRRDRVRQAVSWALAAQTGHYSSSDAARRPAQRSPSFDAELIDGLLREIESGEGGWDRFFAGFAARPLWAGRFLALRSDAGL